MQFSEEQKFATDLIDFINASPSTYHVVRNIKAALLKKNYEELSLSSDWTIEKGGKYFVSLNETSVVMIKVGKSDISKSGFRMIAAHTDSPSIRIKPNPELIAENNYLKLNVEPYGGGILSTWFDRPLSIAGRVVIKGLSPLYPESRFVFFKRPLLIIPNLAIHLNREVNDGVKIHKQFHIQPLLSMIENNLQKDKFLLKLISEEIKVNIDNIIDFDLFLFENHGGELIGANNEFISCSKLDNLSMVHAGIDALMDTEDNISTDIMVCFDNEEVGSQTKQGAGSPFIRNLLERLISKLDENKEAYYKTIHNSFIISADMAHAVHPNYPEMHDQTCRPVINSGPVIKLNANQKYTSDGNTSAVFELLCQKVQVPVQKYVNRSDLAGGSTLGSILTSQLEARSVDIGNPMLAMHSIRELTGVLDHYYMKKVFEEFFKS
jgi:aspartyl aminopeptidase